MGKPDKMSLRLSDSDVSIEDPGLPLHFVNHEMKLSYEVSLPDLDLNLHFRLETWIKMCSTTFYVSSTVVSL